MSTPHKPSRTIRVTLRPAAFERVLAYADLHGMDAPDAVRELVDLGLSATPNEATVLASKQRGYDEVRRWTMTRVAEEMRKLALEAERQVGLEIFPAEERA